MNLRNKLFEGVDPKILSCIQRIGKSKGTNRIQLNAIDWKRGATPIPEALDGIENPGECPVFIYMPPKVLMIKMLLKAASSQESLN